MTWKSNSEAEIYDSLGHLYRSDWEKIHKWIEEPNQLFFGFSPQEMIDMDKESLVLAKINEFLDA